MGNRIAEIRKSQGKSQEWLGEQIGVGKAMISKLENGSSPLTQRYMEDISKALKCTITELLHGIKYEDSRPQRGGLSEAPYKAQGDALKDFIDIWRAGRTTTRKGRSRPLH